MSSKKGHSVPDLFGGYTHYDEHGKKIGRSSPDLFGGYTHYDANGKKTGYSSPSIFGGYNDYDKSGKRTGYSHPDLLDTGLNHYDSKGKKTGYSTRSMLGGYNNYGNSPNSSSPKGYGSSQRSEGCYIATCVYGSYDCPEVWTLRRFRDNTLKSSWLGRRFISLYYAISPFLVNVFGNSKVIKHHWRSMLDYLVKRLKEKGIKDTPYSGV